ncbi:MAG: pseudaminic acid biosynthesis-associated methylase [Betaproteobacteria bacterium]|nr:pseudaminic acid biosynthesis-associated methylase [Betaproteobacteria bacterium]
MSLFKTEQEAFWAGEFGDQYIERNASSNLLAANLAFFSKSLNMVAAPNSCIEFGANIGMNLRALRLLFPCMDLHAIEINPTAAAQLLEFLPPDNVHRKSILEFDSIIKYDITLIKGVLIHIDPEQLTEVYDRLYTASNRYILVCEYYNPSPVTIPYRGHANRLFKRDFCGEMLDRFSSLRLVDYGFAYRRDPNFPQDDISWFLMEKSV